MPFKSRQQSKACFATGGFGGKVDCEEWAHKTNYKSIPKRKSFKEWLAQNEALQTYNAPWGIEVSGTTTEVIESLKQYPPHAKCIASVEFENRAEVEPIR